MKKYVFLFLTIIFYQLINADVLQASAISSGTVNFEGATAGAQTQITTSDGNFVVTTSDSHGMYHLSNAGQDEVYINYHTTSTGTTYSFTVSTTGSASPSSFILSSINLSEYPAGSVQSFSGNIVITGYDASSAQVATYSVAASTFPSNFQSTGGGYTVDLSGTAFAGVVVKSFTVQYTPNGQYVDAFGIDLFSIIIDNPPAVDLNGGGAGNDNTASFTEGDGSVQIAPSATLTDADADNIQSMTVTITNLQDGANEALSLNSSASTAASGLTVTYTAGTGVFAISGSATAATSV